MEDSVLVGSGMLLPLPTVLCLLVALVLMVWQGIWQAAQWFRRGEHELLLRTMSSSFHGTGAWNEQIPPCHTAS